MTLVNLAALNLFSIEPRNLGAAQRQIEEALKLATEVDKRDGYKEGNSDWRKLCLSILLLQASWSLVRPSTIPCPIFRSTDSTSVLCHSFDGVTMGRLREIKIRQSVDIVASTPCSKRVLSC